MVWSKKKKTPQTIIFYLLNFEEKELASNQPRSLKFQHDDGIGIPAVAEFESGANVNWQLPCRDNIFRPTF